MFFFFTTGLTSYIFSLKVWTFQENIPHHNGDPRTISTYMTTSRNNFRRHSDDMNGFGPESDIPRYRRPQSVFSAPLFPASVVRFGCLSIFAFQHGKNLFRYPPETCANDFILSGGCSYCPNYKLHKRVSAPGSEVEARGKREMQRKLGRHFLVDHVTVASINTLTDCIGPAEHFISLENQYSQAHPEYDRDKNEIVDMNDAEEVTEGHLSHVFGNYFESVEHPHFY